MTDSRLVRGAVAAALLVAVVGGALLLEPALIYLLYPPDPDSYERVTVTAYDDNGTELATVEARVADTTGKRFLGLSNTSDLEMGEGMLFVHESEESHGYVMRDMSFPIDIVFVGANETVTKIHHASVPEGSSEKTYRGRGKWVLEVPRGWANETGVDEGDRIAVPPSARDTSA